MTGRLQCRQCGSSLPSGSKYCLECGTPVELVVIDLLDVTDPPVPSESNSSPRQRMGLLVLLGLMVGLVVVLWGVTRSVAPTDEALGSATPNDGEEETVGADPTTAVTTRSLTTSAGPTTSERSAVTDAQRPVLGDDVTGTIVQVAVSTMQHFDLSTGQVEEIDLEYAVFWEGPDSGMVVDGRLFSTRAALIITDLSDGSQLQVRDLGLGTNEMHVAGKAGADSVWLAGYPGPGQTASAIEVSLDGEVRRRVEIPRPFEIRWAEGDDLILESVDGSWRFDTTTSEAVRMPGGLFAFAPGFALIASCNETLECDVVLERGEGLEVVDWLMADELMNGSIELAPDLSGALLHVYGDRGIDFTYIDIRSGAQVDLGLLPIEPYSGVAWVTGSRWLVGSGPNFNSKLLAIDTETGAQVELEFRGGRSESFRTFLPSN